MLVLHRKRNESVTIKVGDVHIRVCVCHIRGNFKVGLGFEAPPHVQIHRDEVWEAIERGLPKDQ